MRRGQIERYLLATMTHFVSKRSHYPQGVEAQIGMGTRHRPGYLGLPVDRKYSSETVTTHYLDGQQIDQPFSYPDLGAQTHWIKTKDLSLGRHTFRLATKFTFTRGNETYRGSYGSPSSRSKWFRPKHQTTWSPRRTSSSTARCPTHCGSQKRNENCGTPPGEFASYSGKPDLQTTIRGTRKLRLGRIRSASPVFTRRSGSSRNACRLICVSPWSSTSITATP